MAHEITNEEIYKIKKQRAIRAHLWIGGKLFCWHSYVDIERFKDQHYFLQFCEKCGKDRRDYYMP